MVGRGSIGAAAPLSVSRDEDGGRYYSTKRGAFHEVFNLPESEPPLTGGGGTARVSRLKDFKLDILHTFLKNCPSLYLLFA